jgi:hypothetical protein
MLVIRDEQLNVFRQCATQELELRLVDHVTRFFNIQAQALGVDITRRLVRVAIRQTHRYALTRERDVYAFVDFMFTLSFDFDRNPSIPWAHRILADPRTPPERKINRLRRTVLCFLQHYAATGVASHA